MYNTRAPPSFSLKLKIKLNGGKILENSRPKRRKEKYNPYTLHIKNGKRYVSFRDGKKKLHIVEVTEEVYAAFDKFELEDKSYLNEYQRHTEFSELSDISLYNRAIIKPKSVDDELWDILRMEAINSAIDNLPEIQRRRVMLRFRFVMKYEEIAEIEQCTVMPIKRSIDRGVEKIINTLKDRGYF